MVVGATGQDYVYGMAGTYSVMIVDTNGCHSVSDSYVVKSSAVTDDAELTLHVQPNPCSQTAVLHVTRQWNHCCVRVFDALGHEVFKRCDLQLQPQVGLSLPVDSFGAAGSYTLELVSGSEKHEVRILKN